ncbi:netrin 1 [Echinococcus multilocularis]|uniref:Netrin 1 n=1 Tax=Echinococcus multilocularis TaxID=6211 RepID=A0A0S4MKR0_ECHMU|nr:netrin 1 [Echinococcus multilocularis]
MLYTLIALLSLTSTAWTAYTPTPVSSTSDGRQASFKVIYESPTSVCYAENRPYLCTPPLTNIAEGVPVVATSTCGQDGRPEKLCKSWTSPSSQQKRTACEICDPRKVATSRGAERLTDRHISSNQTCWVSGRVPSGGTVNLTLSLGKRFEIFYISLQPCGPLPDSIALYKSSDFGRTWKPWQYFSTDCYRAFGLPTSSEYSAQISSANIQEVLCVALKPPTKYNSQGQMSNVIAFSTTIGRSTLQSWSPALIDWMTMTDLQISLTRFPSRRKSSGGERGSGDPTVVLHRRDRSSGQRRVSQKTPIFRLGGGSGSSGRFIRADEERMQADGIASNSSTRWFQDKNKKAKEEETEREKGEGEDVVYFAFSDITVGGRCKCNGHANRCVRDRIMEKNSAGEELISWGPLRCDCQHNTVGADCERCAPGYLDRPWARATNEDANVCKGRHCGDSFPCQCNNHTNSCMFDINLYRKSGGRSGGVCLSCAHNTEGINCHECIAGFTRHPGHSIFSPSACQACECNLHSNSCTFSQHLYLLSKKVSGGVCEDCRHHTTGEKCHHCIEGYYRDWTKPISHPRVCLKCQCHPIGSIGNRPCDRKTGQCHCKPGVTGQTCNRCLDGYKQTRSKITPCVKAVEALIFTGSATRSSSHPAIVKEAVGDESCPPCEKNNKRFRFKKFCRRQAVFRGTVISQEIRGELVRLGVRVHDVWRNKGSIAQRYLPSHVRRNQAPVIPVWVPLTHQLKAPHSTCVCPRFNTDQAYLFISQAYEIPYHDSSELLLEQKSTILPWVESWRRRLMRFAVRQERGRCDGQTESAFPKVRINSPPRRNLHPHNPLAMTSSQSQPLPQLQPRTPRHYYPSESRFSRINAAPAWNQYHYRSMRHVEDNPSVAHVPPPSLPSS